MWAEFGLLAFCISFPHVCFSAPQSNADFWTFYCGSDKCISVRKERWESKECCSHNDVTSCCNVLDMLHRQLKDSIGTGYTSMPIKTLHDTSAPGSSIISFGIGATVAVVIGIVMLLIGCGVAFHYCCKTPTPAGYQSPTITYRQTGLRGRNSQVVSVPLDANQQGSDITISINRQPSEGIQIQYHSEPNPVHSDEPPKYEDVPMVSMPAYGKEEQLSDDGLPSYSSVVSNNENLP